MKLKPGLGVFYAIMLSLQLWMGHRKGKLGRIFLPWPVNNNSVNSQKAVH